MSSNAKTTYGQEIIRIKQRLSYLEQQVMELKSSQIKQLEDAKEPHGYYSINMNTESLKTDGMVDVRSIMSQSNIR